MTIIYEPHGRAREYAPLAANLYSGCSHGCIYCYGPACMRVDRKTFHSKVEPRKDVFEQLYLEAPGFSGDDREVLISFASDPYQPMEGGRKLTRHVLQLFQERDIRFTILTKGGTRAVRDFDILQDSRASFGTSLVFTDDKDREKWEPNSAPVEKRIKAIREAHEMGIRTWISLEPVIDPEQAINLVRLLKGIVDHWKVGKLNYHPLEKEIDWISFREMVIETLKESGADFYIKKDLANIGK